MWGSRCDRDHRVSDPGHGGGRLGQALGPPAGGRLLGRQAPGRGEGRGRRAETDGPGHVLQSGPPGPFLLAADQERIDAQSPTDDQGADAGRAAELVGGHRDQVGAERPEVEGHVSGGGHRVDVDERAPSGRQRLDDLGHRLDRAHLVIGPLAVHERRVRSRTWTGTAEGVLTDVALIRPEARRPAMETTGAERADASPHGRVLDVGTDHRAPGPAAAAPHTAALIGLGAAGGEHHLAGPDAEQPGHLLAGVLEGGPHHPALGVDPARVGGHAPIVPLGHGSAGLGADRRGRGVVEIVTGQRSRSPVRPRRRRRRHRGPAMTTGPPARVPPGSSPHSPASSPLTMPRSTAHSTGYCEAALAERAVVGHHRGARCPGPRRGRANPWAVKVSAMACMAVRSDRWPSPGDIWPARVRPYSSPTRSAIPSAAAGPSSWRASWSSRTSRSSRRVRRSRVGSLPTARNRLDGRPAPCAGGPLHGDLHVAAGGQPLEVVAGDVGMEGEPGRHLGGRGPRVGPDEEIDLAPGRVAERGGHRGDRGGELAVGLGRGRSGRRHVRRGAPDVGDGAVRVR